MSRLTKDIDGRLKKNWNSLKATITLQINEEHSKVQAEAVPFSAIENLSTVDMETHSSIEIIEGFWRTTVHSYQVRKDGNRHLRNMVYNNNHLDIENCFRNNQEKVAVRINDKFLKGYIHTTNFDGKYNKNRTPYPSEFDREFLLNHFRSWEDALSWYRRSMVVDSLDYSLTK